MAGHRPPRGPWVWGGVQAVPPETTASGELGGEAMWRFCAGLKAGEPSSLTGVSALLWFPGLAHSAPLPLHALHRATVKWEGRPPLRKFSACPESLGMPAREHWASGELCFLASEALQSLGCRRETGGQHSLRLGTTGGGGAARWFCSGRDFTGEHCGCGPQPPRKHRNTPSCALYNQLKQRWTK